MTTASEPKFNMSHDMILEFGVFAMASARQRSRDEVGHQGDQRTAR